VAGAVLVEGLLEECRVKVDLCTPYAHLRERFEYLVDLPCWLENSYAACSCWWRNACAADSRAGLVESGRN